MKLLALYSCSWAFCVAVKLVNEEAFECCTVAVNEMKTKQLSAIRREVTPSMEVPVVTGVSNAPYR